MMLTDGLNKLERAGLIALAAGLGLIQLTIFGWVKI